MNLHGQIAGPSREILLSAVHSLLHLSRAVRAHYPQHVGDATDNLLAAIAKLYNAAFICHRLE
jgi:hypothetical protein